MHIVITLYVIDAYICAVQWLYEYEDESNSEVSYDIRN